MEAILLRNIWYDNEWGFSNRMLDVCFRFDVSKIILF